MSTHSLYRRLSSHAIDALLERLRRRSNVFSVLAVSAFVAFAAAISPPFIQQLISATAELNGFHVPDGPVSASVAALIFAAISALCAWLAHKTRMPPENEALVHAKSIDKIADVGHSTIYGYLGSILHLDKADGIEVIVTSEDTSLELASLGSTSVSSRTRRMAATFDANGRVLSDPLSDAIDQWKKENNNLGPFPLGTCVSMPPHNAKNQGVKRIIHAVALEKRNEGQRIVEEHSNQKIIREVIEECRRGGYHSVFLPTFGLGSGGLEPKIAIGKTILPLISELRAEGSALKIYVGTYRVRDFISMALLVRKST